MTGDGETDLFGDDVTARTGISGHTSGATGNDEWLTPPDIIGALGRFTLDPCSPVNRPWPTAEQHYTAADDGLRHPWVGRVWLNPPYSDAARWLARLAKHGRGTALIFARTETATWFEHVWPKATALLFLRGRLHFHYVDGRRAPHNSGAPSVLVAYGTSDAAWLRASRLPGLYMPLAAASLSTLPPHGGAE